MVTAVLFVGYVALVVAGLMGASWVPRVAVPTLGALKAPAAGPVARLGVAASGLPVTIPPPLTSVPGHAVTGTAAPVTAPAGTLPGATPTTRSSPPGSGPPLAPPGQTKRR
jgi:hypothetical protein